MVDRWFSHSMPWAKDWWFCKADAQNITVDSSLEVPPDSNFSHECLRELGKVWEACLLNMHEHLKNPDRTGTNFYLSAPGERSLPGSALPQVLPGDTCTCRRRCTLCRPGGCRGSRWPAPHLSPRHRTISSYRLGGLLSKGHYERTIGSLKSEKATVQC